MSTQVDTEKELLSEPVTYGTEPMPVATLRHLHEALPNVTLKQTYGLTELGILPTQSRAPDELWIRLDRRVVDYKIVDKSNIDAFEADVKAHQQG